MSDLTPEEFLLQFEPLNFYQDVLAASFHGKDPGCWVSGGFCPFHHEELEPEFFFVDLCTGAYKCECCGASGDNVISFRMKVLGESREQSFDWFKNEWKYT